VVSSWADREFSKLTDSISEQLHVPFGEAVYLTGTITLLLDSNLLNFAQTIIFSAQAGAHLSFALKDDNNTLSPEAEQRFLVRPLERFLADRDDQDEFLRDLVGEELSKCLIISAYSMDIVTSSEAQQFANAWDDLVRRERVDVQNRSRILNQEARILNEFAKSVDRLAKFRNRIRQLKFDENGRTMYREIESDLDQWNSMINRLRATL
jgi:hypothetical protein